jgi:O-antigen ligase
LVVCSLPFAIYFLRSGAAAAHRVLAVAAAGIFVVAIVRSGSRGGFLGLIGVILTVLVGFRALPVRTRLGSVAATGVILALVAGPTFWNMMGTILRPEEDYNTSHESGRLEIWKRGFTYMTRHPVLGVGANAFPVAEGTISEEAARQSVGIGFKWSTAHNSFVQIGAEIGVPGLVAFVVLLWHLFAIAWRAGRAPPSPNSALGQALLATLVGYLIAGSFLSQAYSAFLYSTAGLATGLVFVGTSGTPSPPAAVRTRSR